MWVYRKTESGCWTVGFYTPAGNWEPESDHGSADAAAERVRWLNGGDSETFDDDYGPDEGDGPDWK